MLIGQYVTHKRITGWVNALEVANSLIILGQIDGSGYPLCDVRLLVCGFCRVSHSSWSVYLGLRGAKTEWWPLPLRVAMSGRLVGQPRKTVGGGVLRGAWVKGDERNVSPLCHCSLLLKFSSTEPGDTSATSGAVFRDRFHGPVRSGCQGVGWQTMARLPPEDCQPCLPRLSRTPPTSTLLRIGDTPQS